ncbi:feruloyl CoA ortho-hydroxylase 2-like [Tripterygium wilfordii]|uniref:feruloyl CoA ortho-hydroxylase 2-like n=1 Tax=Tripterygium wilfordii TaxID=458696 RepID=UPI0018F81F00|nr:feruloyl CoA ortho-hydroxylase 2-like [Tripterygium wilfordii]
MDGTFLVLIGLLVQVSGYKCVPRQCQRYHFCSHHQIIIICSYNPILLKKNLSMEKKSTSSVPVFDMQNFPGKYEKGLKEACEEWGCFRLVNHTIPISLMSDMKALVSSLFDLPIEIKKNNLPAIVGSCYIDRSQSNPL